MRRNTERQARIAHPLSLNLPKPDKIRSKLQERIRQEQYGADPAKEGAIYVVYHIYCFPCSNLCDITTPRSNNSNNNINNPKSKR